MKDLEEGSQLALDFKKLKKVASTGHDLLPVVVQHAESKEILVVAYTNDLAFQHTLDTRIVTFWSSSRNELWIKGKTSGDTLRLVEVRVNCEQNSLLYLALPEQGGVCHTHDADGHTRPTCYYRRLLPDGALEFID
ncbi:MAG: phosphoribosyl-AMP cyclohydrolase [Candidatus Methylacidiphilales bacterium]